MYSVHPRNTFRTPLRDYVEQTWDIPRADSYSNGTGTPCPEPMASGGAILTSLNITIYTSQSITSLEMRLLVASLLLIPAYGFAPPKMRSGAGAKPLYAYKPDESPAIKEMVDWLLELECEGLEPDDGAVEIGFGLNSGMRGVFAKEELGVGEYIVAVPFPATLVVMETEDKSTTDAERGLTLLRKYLDDDVAPSDETNKWRPYLSSLPKIDYCFDPTPDFWTPDEIQALEFPRIVNEALKRKEQVQQLADTEGVDFDQLQFATWLTKSRCFSIVTVKGEDQVTQTKSVLIPFFDMVNHSSDEPNAELQVIATKAEDESFYAICATRPIPAGAEVTIAYGTTCDSSVELLMNYGLVEDTNQFDAEMLRRGGGDCFWSTTLDEDELELKQAQGNRKTALAFRSRLKQAVQEM